MSPQPLHQPLHQQSASRLAEAVRRGDLFAEEISRACLDRIAAHDPELGCFLHLDPEAVIAEARRIDQRRERGEALGPLAGVPIAIKDNLCTLGLPTTCASKILEGYRPPYEARAVELLRAASAVILGKTNMDEFAMGSSTERSAYQITRNPWDRGRVPGGSSGGSAAAVSAGLCPLALGSDTGGSVRQPAAFCGIAGLKPSYGRVSRYGLVAFASSLDQIGPLAREVGDLALALEVLAGADPRDATSSRAPAGGYLEALRKGPRGLRVGLDHWALSLAEPAVRAAVEAQAEALAAAGVEISPIHLPHAEHAIAAYYLLAPAEASSNLARFDGVRYGRRASQRAGRADLKQMYEDTRGEGFGPEVKRRIMLGTYALSAGYLDRLYRRAQQVRTRIIEDYEAAFREVDAILSPTAPAPAFALGERTEDPLAMYHADRLTLPQSLAGLPALSLFAGLDRGGLPIGAQLTAPALREDTLLTLARALELDPAERPHPNCFAS